MNINSKIEKEQELELARTIQEACIRAANKAFEDASISGLCDEGAFEAAMGAIQILDIDAVLTEFHSR